MHTKEKETNLLQRGPLRIGFHWHRDRFAHSISVEREGRSFPLLASCEGDEHADWPPSPPLQELHFEERSTGRVALLVGCTGGGHWSLAIEEAESGFRFDVACRISGSDTPDRQTALQTAYRAMVAPQPIEGGALGVRVDTVTILSGDGSLLPQFTEGGVDDPAWRVKLAPPGGGDSSKTVCWQYLVNFSPVSDSTTSI